MEIVDLLSPEAVLPAVKATGKKQLLQDLAHHAARLAGVPERRIFETLIERERLGSTGMGQGIAIPHGRLSGLAAIKGLFARLETPVAYDAVDEQPVDLVFLLLAPETAGADHLKALARVSRLLRNQHTCGELRATARADVLYALLTEPTNGGASSSEAA
jgi:PTS system nitrogen regulatory IIA component